MKIAHRLFILCLFILVSSFNTLHAQKKVEFWLTDVKNNILFKEQQPLATKDFAGTADIEIDPEKAYQAIDGFGYTLTSGSAQLLLQMNSSKRKELLEELFSTQGIGVSYLRVAIGASDLSDHVYSYNDLSAGETDLELSKFDLGPDKTTVIPVLQEILKFNPSIKILGSPWSPPVWMKTNQNSKGGSLKPEFYDVYAHYFVKYIQEMAKHQIVIDAITIQNEPLHPGNNPSLLMLPQEQANFIKKSLGPIFESAGVKTKIIIYDHNADKPEYPISILNDSEAKKYIDGSAFHLYGGKIEALSKVHEAHPDKNLYFTEQWVGAPGNMEGDFAFHVKHLIIGAPNNWAKTVIEWNLAATADYKPHTPGGCTSCLGAITLEGDKVTRNPAYYIIAQASKTVRPGSQRVASNTQIGLPNVAYKTPEGKTALIVINDSKNKKDFTVKSNGKAFKLSLNSNAAATLVW